MRQCCCGATTDTLVVAVAVDAWGGEPADRVRISSFAMRSNEILKCDMWCYLYWWWCMMPQSTINNQQSAINNEHGTIRFIILAARGSSERSESRTTFLCWLPVWHLKWFEARSVDVDHKTRIKIIGTRTACVDTLVVTNNVNIYKDIYDNNKVVTIDW